MLSSEQVGDVITELVEARMVGDLERTTSILDGLITGPRADALNVTLVLAGICAMDLGDTPEGGFHRIEAHRWEDGGSLREVAVNEALTGPTATFLQMVVAIANSERDTARALFMGFVGEDWQRASKLLVFALAHTLHQNGMCPTCNPGNEVTSWAV